MRKDPDNLGADFAALQAAVASRAVEAVQADDSAKLDDALGRLQSFVERLLGAEKDDRADIQADLFADSEMFQALARAGIRRNEVQAGLAPLEALAGGKSLARRIEKTIRDIAKDQRGLRVAAADEGQGVRTSLAPVLGDHQIPLLVEPPGFAVTPDGVFRRSDDGDSRINYSPMLITGALVDLYSPEQHLHVEWPTRNGWAQHIVSRSTVMSSRALEQLAGIGAPVSGASSKQMVAYFDAFEAANDRRLPTAYTSSRMGWCGEAGHHGFLVGRRLIRPDGSDRDVTEKVSPVAWGDDYVHLDVSGGFDQVVEGYAQRGSLEAWRQTVERVRPYPVAFLALYAGLVSPLLGVLRNAPNFIVDWAFTSSTGKTTTLRLPASLWGLPEDKDPHGIIGNWDFTTTSLERTLAFHNFLPVILDDTKRAKNPEWVIPQVLYMVAQGRGKGRGAIEGVRQTVTWRTVVLSTGEVPVTSFSQDVGARARTISIRRKPFGDVSQDTGRFIEELTLDLLDHYGHAGPEVIRWLLDRRKSWGKLQQAFERKIGEWAERAEGNQFARRAAPYLALLELAAHIAEQALQIPIHVDALEVALEAVRSGAEDADRARAALEVVYEWSVANRSRLWEKWDAKPEPHNGWVGAISYGYAQVRTEAQAEALCFLRRPLDALLKEHGFDAPGVLTEWWDRGWMIANERGRRTYRTTVGASRPKTIGLDMSVIAQICGASDV